VPARGRLPHDGRLLQLHRRLLRRHERGGSGSSAERVRRLLRRPGDRPGGSKNPNPPEFDTSSKNERTCTNGTSCNPPGNICGAFGENASQNCCVPGDFNGSGKIVCKRDMNDIPRCFGSPAGGGTGTVCPDGYDALNPLCCIQPGNVCQFRDQCCGGTPDMPGTPCVPDASGVLRCAEPSTSCDPRGTVCNPSSANCCEGTTCQAAVTSVTSAPTAPATTSVRDHGRRVHEHRPVLRWSQLRSGHLQHVPTFRRRLHRRRRLLQRPLM
jgi:hypothetical protein